MVSYLSFIAALIFGLVILEMSLFFPQLFWLSALIIAVFIVYRHYRMSLSTRNIRFWITLVFQLLWLLLSIAFLIFIDMEIFKHAWVFLMAMLIPFNLLFLSVSVVPPDIKEKHQTLKVQYSGFLSLLSLYLTAAVSFAFVSILLFSPFVMALVLLICTLFFTWMWLEYHLIPLKSRVIGTLIPSLVAVEAFAALILWPATVFAVAGLWLLSIYIMLGIIRQYLIFGKQGFTKRILGRYALLFVIGFIAIFLTTRWG